DGIRDRNVTGVQTCALPIWNIPLPFVNSSLYFIAYRLCFLLFLLFVPFRCRSRPFLWFPLFRSFRFVPFPFLSFPLFPLFRYRRSEVHTSELQSRFDFVCGVLGVFSFPTRRSSDLEYPVTLCK